MNNEIKLLLEDDKDAVIKLKEKIILYDKNVSYPEDCIEIEQYGDIYTVFERHRNTRDIKVETNRNDAIVYAVVLYKRLFSNTVNNAETRKIRNFIKLGEEEKVIRLIDANLDKSIYMVDRDDYEKISLVKYGELASVKFHGEYLVKDVSLSRAYVVLYNFSIKVKVITCFYDTVARKVATTLTLAEIQNLYIFGKTIKYDERR